VEGSGWQITIELANEPKNAVQDQVNVTLT
jgi:hypothetical protein